MRPPEPLSPPERSRLEAGFAAGRARWGAFELGWDAFAARAVASAERRAAAARATRAEILDRLVLEDLYLACACDARDGRAWEVVLARLGERITALLVTRGVPARAAREVVAELPGQLYAEGGFTGYEGSGTLFGWLAVVAIRARAGAGRRPRPALLAESPVGPDPRADDAAADAESGERFAAALRSAFAQLPPRQRLVLKLRYGDGVRQTEIARALGIGEPRVSRLLQRALAVLRPRVERALPGAAEELGRLWPSLRNAAARTLAAAEQRP
jgi:RNA polymerase sigma factor (sigma-70 family)